MPKPNPEDERKANMERIYQNLIDSQPDEEHKAVIEGWKDYLETEAIGDSRKISNVLINLSYVMSTTSDSLPALPSKPEDLNKYLSSSEYPGIGQYVEQAHPAADPLPAVAPGVDEVKEPDPADPLPAPAAPAAPAAAAPAAAGAIVLKPVPAISKPVENVIPLQTNNAEIPHKSVSLLQPELETFDASTIPAPDILDFIKFGDVIPNLTTINTDDNILLDAVDSQHVERFTDNFHRHTDNFNDFNKIDFDPKFNLPDRFNNRGLRSQRRELPREDHAEMTEYFTREALVDIHEQFYI
jgi:hypothetical protein